MSTSPQVAAMSTLTRAALAIALALGLPLDAQATDRPRFAGEAALAPARVQISANSRFELTAALSATPHDAGKSGGRFELRAKLASNAPTAVCGPLTDEVFSDGFE